MKDNIELDIKTLENVSEYWWTSLILTIELPNINVKEYDDWAKEIEAGYKFVNKGEWASAEEHFEKATRISSSKNESVAPFLSIIAKLYSGKILSKQQALPFLQPLLTIAEQNPTVSLYWHYLAIMHIKSKNFNEALQYFNRAVECDESFGLGWAAIAFLNGLGRCYQKSYDACHKALELKKELQNGLVQLCLLQADYQLNQRSGHYPFDLDFFNDVTPDEAIEYLSLLPELHNGYTSEKDIQCDATLFIFADNNYFYEHAYPQILSAIDVGSKNICIHVHVCNPDDNVNNKILALDKLNDLIAIEYTFENIDVESINIPSVYYSCVRFCRLFEFLVDAQSPMIMMDADMLIKQPLTSLINQTKNTDAMLCQFEAEPLWQNIAAGVISLNNNKQAIQFAASVSTYILKHLFSSDKKGRWFLDQICLSIAHDKHLQSMSFDYITHDYCDIEHKDDSIIWAVTNDKALQTKYNDLKQQLIEKYTLNDLFLNGFNEVTQGKYGSIIYNQHDEFIGKNIKEMGVWCDSEIDLLKHFLSEGSVVIDAGANYGSHTLAFCKYVGTSGKVYAFEPQRLVFQALCGSVALNSYSNAYLYNAALGSKISTINIPELDFNQSENFGGVSLVDTDKRNKTLSQHYNEVSITTIDSLNLTSCNVIKIDVEGMESDVIKGAIQTIKNFRPILFVENHDDANRNPLIDLCKSLTYELYWYGSEFDPNMLCIPKENNITVNGLTKI